MCLVELFLFILIEKKKIFHFEMYAIFTARLLYMPLLFDNKAVIFGIVI
jgi:hypothetical protein